MSVNRKYYHELTALDHGILENSIIQIISFHITWFIYKKLTRSTLAYWKVFCLSLLGIVVSLGKGDGFYYQVVIFLALALKERRKIV